MSFYIDGFLAELRVLDDVESLLCLVKFRQKDHLPWGWPTLPEEQSGEVATYKELKEERETLKNPHLGSSLPTLKIEGEILFFHPTR